MITITADDYNAIFGNSHHTSTLPVHAQKNNTAYTFIYRLANFRVGVCRRPRIKTFVPNVRNVKSHSLFFEQYIQSKNKNISLESGEELFGTSTTIINSASIVGR